MEWDGMVWAWSIGVFFCFLYIYYTTCSIGIGIGLNFTVVVVSVCLAMERMGYHSIVIYIHVAMDTQGVVDMDMDFIDTCIVCGTFSDCARTDGIFFLMLLAISFICGM